ncbi:hypothetical protein [Limnobacter sp.]|uniref:hypothetical protein n=1 Tax=Limnobacter sp. TaxID=2003368 RepID=UPI002FE1C71E
MKKITLFLATTWLATSLALAAPGAHGPDGEHIDAPGASSTAAAQATPRTETFTENFELVATLYSSELSVLVDDYKTNAPILNAQLQVEVGDLTAKATFHEDAGDYAFDDPTLLQVLQQPGKHALIFTLLKDQQTDLLLATLNTQSEGDDHDGHDDHGHEHGLFDSPLGWIGAALALVLLIALVLRVRRKTSHTVSKKISS